MKQSPDLNALNVLVSVVNAGGFSAAARRLQIPANRLSRQVQRMEADLGVRLLQRTTRRMSLTSAGRALIEQVGPALQQIEAGWRAAGLQAELPAGHLRVAAPADFVSLISAGRLAVFLEAYPAVTLELVLSDDVADLLSAGIDLALRAGPIRGDTPLARRITHSRRVVVASPGWIDRHAMPSTPAELSALPCLSWRSREGHDTWRLNGPAGPVQIDVRARLTVNGMGALRTAAKAGMGAALLPHRMVAQDLADGALVRLVPDYDFETDGFFAIYPTRRQAPAAVRAFLEFVVAESDR
jgi:LysR family transcriptional regulator AphB